jgi:hypothetical protein
MHPFVLESIAQQRLDDLKADRHGKVRDRRRDRRNRSSSGSGSGPIGRTQSRVGIWMVTTGWRLVRSSGATSPPLRSLPSRPVRVSS